jgi:serine/threonine protein kinase
MIAVHRAKNGVSIRPVIVTESMPEPCIVRFVGREIRSSTHLLARQQDYLMRLSESDFSNQFDWGGKSESLWFSRPIYRSNLSDLLIELIQLQPQQAAKLIQNLVKAVDALHRQGVVHGHICLSNIAILETTSDPLAVTLVDAGTGLISFQAGFNREHYRIDEFGPEVTRGDQSVFSTDLFGIGVVIRTILSRVDQTSRDYDQIAPLLISSRRLSNNDPLERGSLREILTDVGNVFKALSAVGTTTVAEDSTESRPRLEQGKILTRDSFRKDVVVDPRAIAIAPVRNQPIHVPFDPTGTYATPVRDETPKPSPRTNDDSLSTRFWLILLLALAAIFYYRVQPAPLEEPAQIAVSNNEQNSYVAAWSSFIPSRMLEVAERAVSSAPEHAATRKIAESVIVTSVRAGDIPLTGVNSVLIRVAFNEAWELELNADDRRAALALGLGGLLKGKFPTDLKSLDSIHPGVLFALVATIRDSESAREHLSEIPALILTKLPVPYGTAFKRLIDNQRDLTFGNPAIELLARIGVRGPELDELSRFLATDSEVRAQALAIMLSRSNELSEKAINIFLNQPTQLAAAQWARAFKINEWAELTPTQRLMVIAGMTPTISLSADRLGRLLGHPSPSIRAFAAGQLKSLVHFEHPGAVSVLEQVSQDGSLLTPEQLVGLARILAMKKPYDLEFLNRWIASNPNPSILGAMLLATTEGKIQTTLDTVLVAGLQRSNWTPGIDDLRRLSKHANRNARLFAYGLIFALGDKEVARDLLEFALGDEKDEPCRESLVEMLKAI